MNAFGADSSRDFRMIVNDQRHAAFRRDGMELGGEFFNIGCRIIFRPQLQQIDSAGDERFRDFRRFANLDIAEIENAVEAAAAEIGGSQARDYSCNRAGIALSSKDSELMRRSTNPVS